VVEMTENEQEINLPSYSKFSRIAMVIVSMLLIFGGPTYVPYAMFKLNVNGYASAGVGAVLFIIGLVFMLFLVKKKVITE
jgi:hypothetical protein